MLPCARATTRATASAIRRVEHGAVPTAAVTPADGRMGGEQAGGDAGWAASRRAGVLTLTDPDAVSRYSRWLDQLVDVARTGPAAAELCREVAGSLPE